MGMSKEGRGRIQWVRLLVVVLALTASRNNFPIFKCVISPPSPFPSALTIRTPVGTKKPEGVTPSRRNVESRKGNWLQNSPLDSSPQLVALRHSTELATAEWAGLRRHPLLAREASLAQPDYLQLYLQDSQVSTLPPPL
jgi:hypothetical protein